MRGGSSEPPRIPILPILEHYGADSVPDNYRWTAMKCPFHGDRTASASVNTDPSEQRFTCHSCGITGQAAHVIMKVEDVEYPAAVERAEEIAGTGNTGVHEKRRGRGRISKDKGHPLADRPFRRRGRG